jgi:hypothetical protein
MGKQERLLLLAELRAIELWDWIYALYDLHDAVDEAAWLARRDRQAAIYERMANVLGPILSM